MVKETEKQIEKPRCSKCGSTQIYFRLKTKDRYCRMCSYIEKLGDQNEGKD